MKHIIFRADAGKNIGFGHFIRSLALAGYLKDYFQCEFFTFNPDEHHASEYQLLEISKICKYHHIVAESINEFNKTFIDSLSGDEIVVLDNYYFTTEYQKQIKDKGCRLVCIDDMHDRHMVADVIFTSCPLKINDFSLEPYTRFYGGIEWAFLRTPFLMAQNQLRTTNHDIKSVVIAVGGADPYGLTNKLAEILFSINPSLKISIIAGDTVEISDKYSDIVSIYRRLSAEGITNIFYKSDLGVFSASTICVEAIACKLPIAAGWYVDNQKEFYNNGVERNYFMPIGNFFDNSDKIKANIISCMQKYRNHIVPNIDFNSKRHDIVKIFNTL